MHQIGSSERPDLPLAIVVGAGGMGMAVARRLGQSQRLLIADRNAEHLEQQLMALRADGYDVTGAVCDVTAPDDVAKLAAAAQTSGPARTLAHVVGLSPSMGDFRRIMSVNLIGATRVAEALLPAMASGGSAVFISSTAAHMRLVPTDLWPLLDAPLAPGFLDRLIAALPTEPTSAEAYMLSKAALIRMCERLAGRWGERGLRILSLSPGLIATPQGALEFENAPGKHALLAAIPLQREGTMLEIANVVEFLTSAQASFLSGADILVDGGMMANLRHGKGQ